MAQETLVNCNVVGGGGSRSLPVTEILVKVVTGILVQVITDQTQHPGETMQHRAH